MLEKVDSFARSPSINDRYTITNTFPLHTSQDHQKISFPFVMRKAPFEKKDGNTRHVISPKALTLLGTSFFHETKPETTPPMTVLGNQHSSASLFCSQTPRLLPTKRS
jgi:hypothetical protein